MRGMCGKRVMVADLSCILGQKRVMILHLVRVLIPKKGMTVQTGCFQYTERFKNLGMILKKVMTVHLCKGLNQGKGDT